MADYSLADMLQGRQPSRATDEDMRQRNVLKYGEPWTAKGIANLPNRLADIGNQAFDELTRPSPYVNPLLWSGPAWMRVLSDVGLQGIQQPPVRHRKD